MSPEQLDRHERAVKAAFYLEVRRQIFGWLEDCRRAGLTDPEIEARLEAEKDEFLEAFQRRLAEVRPAIVQARYGITEATDVH